MLILLSMINYCDGRVDNIESQADGQDGPLSRNFSMEYYMETAPRRELSKPLYVLGISDEMDELYLKDVVEREMQYLDTPSNTPSEMESISYEDIEASLDRMGEELYQDQMLMTELAYRARGMEFQEGDEFLTPRELMERVNMYDDFNKVMEATFDNDSEDISQELLYSSEGFLDENEETDGFLAPLPLGEEDAEEFDFISMIIEGDEN